MTASPEPTDAAGATTPGRLSDMLAEDRPQGAASAPAAVAWVKALVLAVLFGAVVYPQYHPMVRIWQHDANWSWGFILPLFSVYLLWERREQLFSVRRTVCLWGLPLAIVSLAAMFLAVYPVQNLWLSQLASIPLALGLILYVGGWRLLKITWLPVAFLALSMPIPEGLYNRLALPLQNFAAAASTGLLQLFGVEIGVKKSALTVVSLAGNEHQLTVAEACSGIRSLMMFVALGVAWAYIEDRPMWQRLTLVLAGLPIAVACNVLRVSLTCTMYVIDKPELGKDFMHAFMGMALLVPALLLFFLIGRLLNSLYVEVEDNEADEAGDPEAGNQAPRAGEVQA